MTKIAKTTAIAIAAVVSMNMIGTSAFAGAAGKHFPHAVIHFATEASAPSAPSTPTATQSNQATSGFEFSYKPQKAVGLSPTPTPNTQTSFGWDVRTTETRLQARAHNGGVETTTSTIVAAPTTPTPDPAPCGPVGIGPNGQPLVTSSTC
jgi:hypothetical protein